MYKRYALFLNCFVSLVTFLKGSSRISSSNCRCPPWLLLRWCLTDSSVNFAGSSRLVTVNTHSNVWGSCPSQFRTYGLKTYRCPVYEYEKTKHSMCEAFVQANLTRLFWKLTVVLCIDMKTPSIQCVRRFLSFKPIRHHICFETYLCPGYWCENAKRPMCENLVKSNLLRLIFK